jgi:hypothetical protein
MATLVASMSACKHMPLLEAICLRYVEDPKDAALCEFIYDEDEAARDAEEPDSEPAPVSVPVDPDRPPNAGDRPDIASLRPSYEAGVKPPQFRSRALE